LNRLTKIIQAFEKDPQSYHKWYEKPKGAYVFAYELHGLNSMLPEAGVGLDIGAGSGIFAANLISKKRIIICLDPSMGMLNEARKRSKLIINGTAENLPFRRKIFDFIYMVTVIEFLTDPIKALNNIKQNLKNASPILILFIDRESQWGRYYKKLAEERHPIFTHAKLFTSNNICDKLEQTGYQILGSVDTLTIYEQTRLEGVKKGLKSKKGAKIIKAQLCPHNEKRKEKDNRISIK
jgi:ubiquinone/menaquinone biosynthesis C-methylase UbiE